VLDIVGAMVAAFGVVFVAELGDKTQLLALGFGAQHPLRLVAAGLTLGYGIANLLAVIVGGILGAALPERPIQVVSGVLFFGFAAVAARRALRGDAGSDTDDVEPPDEVARTMRRAASPTSPLRVVGAIGLAIAVAEMGDKTQITTATLASQSAPVGVWVGATLGAAASGMVGAVAGRSVGHRISTRAVDIASAVLFAVFGVAILAGWF
jgi:putative Ca2+/H+ antiporter (TMEM165/GDT1 family)